MDEKLKMGTPKIFRLMTQDIMLHIYAENLFDKRIARRMSSLQSVERTAMLGITLNSKCPLFSAHLDLLYVDTKIKSGTMVSRTRGASYVLSDLGHDPPLTEYIVPTDIGNNIPLTTYVISCDGSLHRRFDLLLRFVICDSPNTVII